MPFADLPEIAFADLQPLATGAWISGPAAAARRIAIT